MSVGWTPVFSYRKNARSVGGIEGGFLTRKIPGGSCSTLGRPLSITERTQEVLRGIGRGLFGIVGNHICLRDTNPAKLAIRDSRLIRGHSTSIAPLGTPLRYWHIVHNNRRRFVFTFATYKFSREECFESRHVFAGTNSKYNSREYSKIHCCIGLNSLD